MSFTIFLAICVVGSDLLIFVLCHRVFGEKYRARARRVAARRGAAKVRISTPLSGLVHKPGQRLSTKRSLSFDGPAQRTRAIGRNVDVVWSKGQ